MQVRFGALSSSLVLSLFAAAAHAQQVFHESQIVQGSAVTERSRFGRTMHADDGTLVVSASVSGTVTPQEESAYVFVRAGSSWVEEARLIPNDPTPTGNFGSGVAVDGDTILVGQSGEGLTFSGGDAYVFVRNGTTWTQQAKLISPTQGNGFGWSVTVDGDTAAIGAPADPEIANAAGAVFVYQRSGTTWSFSTKLTVPDGQEFDLFGNSVALQGDTLCAGSVRDDGAAPDGGSVFVYERTGTTWSLQAELFASTPQMDSHFGEAIALDGDVLVVGSDEDGEILDDQGAVFVFRRGATTWTEEQKLVSEGLGTDDFLGFSVDVRGDAILAGARGSNFNGGIAGSSHLFRRTGTTWIETARLIGSVTDSGDENGAAVALSDGFAFSASYRAEPFGIVSGEGYAFRIDGAELELLCAGNGGDQMGCSPCPCGNESPAGGYAGCLNAAGTGARLKADGRASVAMDDLSFDLVGANPSTFAVLVSGDNALPNAGMCPPGSGIPSPLLDGLRCVGGNLLRHGVRVIDANGSVGETNSGWGPPANPPGGISQQGGFVAGQRRHFQVFYRENGALQCTTGQNTSTPVSVLFVP